MNGSIGNTTITRNAYGPYSKMKLPGFPAGNTTWNLITQDLYRTLQDVWRDTFTDDIRQEWQQAAVDGFRKQVLKRSLGNVSRQSPLSGREYWFQYAFNVSLIGSSPLPYPPVLAPMPLPVPWNFYNTSAGVLGIHTGNIGFGLDDLLMISATKPLPASRMSPNQTYFNLYDPLHPNDNHAIANSYAIRLGVLPNPGQKIFVKGEQVNGLTGQRWPAQYLSCIVT